MSGSRGHGVVPAATVSSEAGTVAVIPGRPVSFGRGSDTDLRIGAAPVYDSVVPRYAGRVVALGHRVFVENVDDNLALDLRHGDHPLIPVSPGHAHSPAADTFDIIITGVITSYELAVRINTNGTRPRLVSADAPIGELDPPTGATPDLTDRQRDIMRAYVGPMRDGGSPATHQQVAGELGISRSLVRVECERIWSALFLAGVPMRDLGNARDEIIDAWSRHRF